MRLCPAGAMFYSVHSQTTDPESPQSRHTNLLLIFLENTFSNDSILKSHASRSSKTLAQEPFCIDMVQGPSEYSTLQGDVRSYEETGTHLPYWSRGPTRRTGRSTIFLEVDSMTSSNPFLAGNVSSLPEAKMLRPMEWHRCDAHATKKKPETELTKQHLIPSGKYFV
ncbi:hypothetical protein TWF718_004065 [Orbilia javanica]|uniref:Uncharacterized protein n=1 Tax=Orbilia javanica TaxID=47235 RepID=A0AAN8MRR6_9PEZI